MSSFIRLVMCLLLACPISYAANNYEDLDLLECKEKEKIKENLKCDPKLAIALYQIAKDASEVLDHYKIPYSAGFGTLLGAIRHHGIIPHDDDLDFIITKEDIPKLLTTKDDFKKLGYTLFSDMQEGHENIVGYKLYSEKPITLTNGKSFKPFLDLFVFKKKGDKYIVYPKKGRKMFPKAAFTEDEFNSLKEYNFGEFKLKGFSNPKLFLTRFYGENWDKQIVVSHNHRGATNKKYKWTKKENDLAPAQPIKPLRERARPFYETGAIPAPLAANNDSFWNTFYQKNDVSLEASTFATFLIKENYVKKDTTLFEIACGNGRDTFFFQENQLHAFGIDLSEKAIETNRKIAQERKVDPDIFEVADINKLEKMKKFKDFDNIYARFFIHSISDEEQARFFDFLKLTKPGSQLLLEFRTNKDPMLQKSTHVSHKEGVTDHYRRYIDFSNFCKFVKELNYDIIYKIEARDLSVRGDDNPYLGRIIAVKS